MLLGELLDLRIVVLAVTAFFMRVLPVLLTMSRVALRMCRIVAARRCVRGAGGVGRVSPVRVSGAR